MEASRWVCGNRQGTLNPTPESAARLAAEHETTVLIEKLNQAKIDISSLGRLNWPLVDVIYTLEVKSSEAEDAWRRLRSVSIGTGYWPVIVSSIDDLEGLVDNISCHLEFDSSSGIWSPRKQSYNNSDLVIDEADKTVQLIRELKKIEGNSEPLDLEGNGLVKPAPTDLIVAGEKLNMDKWLELKHLLNAEFDNGFNELDWPSDVEPDDNLQSLLSWDPEVGLQQLDSVFILLVRADYSWEVPAKLLYGGWNDCPVPQVHVGFLKRWFSKHDAEIISIGRATMELIVSKPPTDRDQALQIAREQYIYCPDSVEQGSGTLPALAAEILKGRVWHFWWD